MLAPPLFGRIVPLAAGEWISTAGQLLSTILETLLLWVGFQGIRKNRIEGLLAIPAILLIVFGHLDWFLRAVNLPTEFHPFGILVRSYQPGTMLSLGMVTVLLLHRFYRTQRERDQWRQEMEQARQVQQMLVPDALPTHSVFVLESEYRPAQQVGGDFFQILPNADGGLLVIIGDVSGKGLKAAMLVSMIVGAIRTIAEHTHEPLEILQGLNRRLCGRLNLQFATCLAIRIAANGNCIAANAGHLAPYLNGHEVALAGSVPLGLIEGAEFEQVTFALEPGDRLVFITDGIVEAQDSAQQLFGFARTTKLVEQSHSAAEVAITAQDFGQEDDISVISVTLTGVMEPVTA
jgi:serine phosphatase RsbU (regulator of sigma subunit)